jgi:8-oxo-dGTP pyrophosphatase MutT (NUDIX family)
MNAPARPRDAATLVLWRRSRHGIEVLMGCRAGGHRFLPHHYAFPGGRFEADDARATVLSELRPEVAVLLAAHCRPPRGRALAVAAVREAFEETGLALGEVREGVLSPALDRLDYLLRAITPATSPVRFHARFFTVEGGLLAGELRSNGELLDLRWRTLEEGLQLSIAKVTEFILRRAAAEQSLSFKERVELFSFRSARPIVRRSVRRATPM